MKKISNFIAIVAITILALLSCTKKVDPIHDTEPVNKAFSQKISVERLNSLRIKGDVNEQFALIDRYRKQLTANIVSQYPNIKDSEQISLILGTGYADAIEAGDGKIYSGNFSEELIIIINDSVKTDTVFFFGGQKPKSELKFKKKFDFGHGEPFRFTIKDKEKIDSIIASLKDWAYVVNINVPIKNKDGETIEEQTFAKYLMDIKPLLREGDVIDIINGKVFDKDSQEVTLEKRKSEPTKKRR